MSSPTIGWRWGRLLSGKQHRPLVPGAPDHNVQIGDALPERRERSSWVGEARAAVEGVGFVVAAKGSAGGADVPSVNISVGSRAIAASGLPLARI